jgi:hypothetical protein
MRAVFVASIAVLALACGSRAPEAGLVKVNPHDGLWQEAAEPPFRFVLEQSFGGDGVGDPGAMLIQIGQVAVDGDGNVYLYDLRAPRLVSYRADGTLRWSMGSAGAGPGEIDSPQALLFDGERLLYVSNQRGRRMDRFTVDGSFVDSHESTAIGSGGTILPVGFLSADTLVVSEPIRGKQGIRVSVVGLGDEWAPVRSFDIVDSAVVAMPEYQPGYLPARVIDGRIVVGSTSEYRIRVVDRFGNVERVVTRADVPMLPPFINNAGQVPIALALSEVGVLGRVGDYWIIHARWPTNVTGAAQFETMIGSGAYPEFGLTVDLYDADWSLLYSFTGEDVGDAGPLLGLASVDSTDRAYVRLGDGATLGRYRMEVNEGLPSDAP